MNKVNLKVKWFEIVMAYQHDGNLQERQLQVVHGNQLDELIVRSRTKPKFHLK